MTILFEVENEITLLEAINVRSRSKYVEARGVDGAEYAVCRCDSKEDAHAVVSEIAKKVAAGEQMVDVAGLVLAVELAKAFQ